MSEETGYKPAVTERPTFLDWDAIKQLLVVNQFKREFDPLSLPTNFNMGPVMLDTFDQMLKRRTFRSKLIKAARRGNEFLSADASEVARRLLVRNNTFLVEKQDTGESRRHLSGVSVTVKPRQDQIGLIHTHPVDELASSGDLVSQLMRTSFFDIIVTPDRVIVFMPTQKTPRFNLRPAAEGYLEGMGRAKGRMLNSDPKNLEWISPELAWQYRKKEGFGIWTTLWQDLRELHIFGYESKRDDLRFTLKTDQK